ncbi:BI2L1 protein, partial [Sagittarius serpentarius]|nr:BI2L1 protein [Sagittarius serpentarius]
GQVLVEISRTHKKLNDSLEESFKKFHKEIISELEKKTDLDVKYMNATLKRYQTEHRSKLDSLEKSQAELKKIRRKSQGARNVMKYEHKEMEYLETVSSRQSDIQRFIAEGCREALLEEKRRFCFLVDKHCSFIQHMHFYHIQCADFLKSKLPGWQEICSDATKVPEKVRMMIDEIKTPGSTPVSGTPQPSPMIERNTMIGSDFYPQHENASKVPPAPIGRAYTSPLVDMFNNPGTVPKTSSEKLNSSAGLLDYYDDMNSRMCRGVENSLYKVFISSLLFCPLFSFERSFQFYVIEKLSHYRKGWFPSSYTRPLEEPAEEKAFVPVPSPAPIRSISSVNLVEKGDVVLPPPDYLGSLQTDKRMESSNGTTVKTPTDRPENAG